ncbi:golvesin C-terminal-like domain-containing protein [Streptacidiphilus cavernicola]|uniref:Tat pathway signal protein n=1 Tax=Streptacidiphilus cavernicola TaxID=3342716 RepID=A0ABV6W037_9ACTN
MTGVAALAAAAVVGGLIQGPTAVASPASAVKAAPAAKPSSGPGVKNPDSVLGKGWKASSDRAVTSAADSDGLHLLVADSKDAYAWRTAAVLAEPGMPADSWIGNQCVIDASHAAVVYAPRSFTNQQDLMLGGAFAAVVNLDTGAVTKLPFTASLAYFDPTCNPSTHTAVFTAYRDDKTRLVTVNSAGAQVADTSAAGQVTSAVPVADGAVAALGNRLVHISRAGKATTLTATDSVPYDIRPTGKDTRGKDSFGFLDHKGQSTAHAKVWKNGKVATVATGALDALSLQQAGTGTVFLAGHPKGTPKTAGTGITAVAAGPDADVSSQGRLAVDPVLTPGVEAGLANIADAGRDFAASAAKTAPTPQPAAVAPVTANGPLTLTATATATGKKVTETVVPTTGAKADAAHAASGLALSPALGGTAADAGSSAGSSTGTGAAKQKALTTDAVTDDHNPVDTGRWCSVPRNDISEQALQPTPNQVEWAVDMAVRGDLNASWVSQGGWRTQIGLGTVDPQALFPSPTLAGGGRIPAQVELGVLAQESNLWQAESGAVPGQMGNPLASVAGFYGHTGTDPAQYWKIDWTKSDCGYGVGQVTDGMRLAGHEKPGETSLSPTVQKAVALDYTVNVAASLQILADKWNEIHTAGQTMTINNDDASKPENWFAAIWNYNSGFNPPGSSGGAWGLGWYNNPANPIYPPTRLAFMDTSLDALANHDAAHPQDWPYEEKVMGWAAWSIDTGHSYATSGRQDWPGESGFSSAGFEPAWWLTAGDRSAIKPPLSTFCDASNACDVSNPPPCETQHIDGCDQLHWWNAANTTWKTDCADYCGHESIKYATLRAEPGRGTRLQYGQPDCSAPPAGALVVDSIPDGTPTWSDCGDATSSGNFQFTFYPDSDGNYEAKGDLHQIGGGYQGHFWYAHDRSADHLGGDGGPMTVLGDWTLGSALPSSASEAQVYVHIPDTGGQTTQAIYQVVTPFGTVDKTISQSANESNKWVSLGAYRFNGQAPEVRLSNSNYIGTGDNDIAWDAVAFVPGNYDKMPDVTFPAAVPDAPDPDSPDDPVAITQASGSTPAALKSNAAVSGKSTAVPSVAPGHCSAASASGVTTCVTLAKATPAALAFAAKARQKSTSPTRQAQAGTGAVKQSATASADDSLCTDLAGGRNFTRFASCTGGLLGVNQYVDESLVASETFVMEQTTTLTVNNTQIQQTMSLTPYQATPDIGEVSLNVDFECRTDCTAPVPSWSSPPLWATFADQHTATATATSSWTQTTGSSLLDLSWVLSGTINGGATDTAGWYEPELTIRCDNTFNGKLAGCVFPKYTPTFNVNSKANPAAAALYWVLQQKLSNHPGSKAFNSPLHRLADTTLQTQNRNIMCKSAAAKWVKNPNTPTSSCDEYPFAASQESGGSLPGFGLTPGMLTGKDCVQIYSAPVGSAWQLYIDPNYPLPDWTINCGRGSIPLTQNTTEGGSLGRWSPTMRVMDGDAYYVNEPGFEGCNPDTVCAATP